jgi:hypothetical protein
MAVTTSREQSLSTPMITRSGFMKFSIARTMPPASATAPQSTDLWQKRFATRLLFIVVADILGVRKPLLLHGIDLWSS